MCVGVSVISCFIQRPTVCQSYIHPVILKYGTIYGNILLYSAGTCITHIHTQIRTWIRTQRGNYSTYTYSAHMFVLCTTLQSESSKSELLAHTTRDFLSVMLMWWCKNSPTDLRQCYSQQKYANLHSVCLCATVFQFLPTKGSLCQNSKICLGQANCGKFLVDTWCVNTRFNFNLNLIPTLTIKPNHNQMNEEV